MVFTVFGDDNVARPQHPDFARVVDAVLWCDANSNRGAGWVLDAVGLDPQIVYRYSMGHGDSLAETPVDDLTQSMLNPPHG